MFTPTSKTIVSARPMALAVFSLVALIVAMLATTRTVNADINSIRNFYQFDEQILSSGQPNRKQLENASNANIEVVINLVPESESIYNPSEDKVLKEQGIEYLHTPVSWASPKQAEIEAFFAAMESVGDRKVLVHCWANARASALVYVYRNNQKTDQRTDNQKSLSSIWHDIAGYDLSSNKTWQRVVKDYSAREKNN